MSEAGKIMKKILKCVTFNSLSYAVFICSHSQQPATHRCYIPIFLFDPTIISSCGSDPKSDSTINIRSVPTLLSYAEFICSQSPQSATYHHNISIFLLNIIFYNIYQNVELSITE